MNLFFQVPAMTLVFSVGARPLVALALLAVAVVAGVLIDRAQARRFARTQL